MTFTYSPNEGGQTILHVKALDGTQDYTASIGSASGGGRAGGAAGGRGGGGGGGAPSFSSDSRWAAYMVTPEGRGAGRGGAGRGRGGAQAAASGAQEAPTVAHLELLNLASGEKAAIPNAGSWKFSSDAHWLAVKLNRAPGAAGPGAAASNGSDLIVRDMTSGVVRNIGNVNQFDFDDAGRLLAYTLEVPERLGNGVYLLDPSTGESRALNTAQADYDQLTWSPSGNNLVVLRGDKPRGMKQRENSLFAWQGVSTAESKAIVYDPAKDASFPKGMVLSELSAPRWSRDGSRVFVGVKQQEAEVPAADSNKANVDIWHWKDQTPQSVQIVQIQQLRRATLPAVVLLASNKLVKLGDDNARAVTPAANSNVAIARNDSAYRGEVAWGANRADVYKVDVATGART